MIHATFRPRGLAAALAAGLLLCTPAVAADLAAPEGDVILTVSGAIANTTDGTVAAFDRAALEALAPTTFRTETIWTEGVVEFTGVELDDLLAHVGATGEALHAIALNDYKVDIPVADAVDGGPIVAYLMNGEPMSVRDKGPLWIVYPYDSNDAYQAEVIYSRSIWQLDRIEVVE